METSPEKPLPLRTVSRMIADWVGRLGWVWLEGQVTQVSARPGAATAFLTLRDPAADVSMTVTCPRALLGSVDPPVVAGARVVLHGHPDFYFARGTLSLVTNDIRHVGVGELLARLERLKQILAAEGLFAAERKRPLPFLPRVVGLVTGRGSAAEHDVVEVARRRWPSVRFRIENVAVQGAYAVPAILAAIAALERDPDVDVIVVARGGGSVEDLLPFSDESLCRAVAACFTPVVSAIGHETDAPLLDFVADVRAATPTDAAKRVVPDAEDERRRISGLRQRAYGAVDGRLRRERENVARLRQRPGLARPYAAIDARERDVRAFRDRSSRSLRHVLAVAGADVAHARARVRALSPAATLARGYAVVQTVDGRVVRSASDVAVDDDVRVRLATGALTARVTGLRGGS